MPGRDPSLGRGIDLRARPGVYRRGHVEGSPSLSPTSAARRRLERSSTKRAPSNGLDRGADRLAVRSESLARPRRAHQRPAACATTLDRPAFSVSQVEVETLRLRSKPAYNIESGPAFLRCWRVASRRLMRAGGSGEMGRGS